MGEWAVTEYECSSGRSIRVWGFPSFTEAEEFRAKREALYRTIGLEKQRTFGAPLPKISDAEMELFRRIIENPRWMSFITRQLVE